MHLKLSFEVSLLNQSIDAVHKSGLMHSQSDMRLRCLMTEL